MDNAGNIYGITIEIATVNRCSGYNIIKIDSTGTVTTLLPAPADVCDDGIRDSGIGLSNNDIIITGKWGQRILKISQQGVISDYIQPQEGAEPLNITVNVADLSLSLKVPVNIRATKYIYGTKTYSYDSTNRLTSVMRGVLDDEAYSYDTVGNRLNDIRRNTYNYNTNNQLLNYDGITFAFDLNGNMTSKTDATGTTRYTYNSENQLIRVDLPDGRYAEYKYDPFNRRIQKRVVDALGTENIRRYVYDNEDILFELDSNGNVVTEYLHGPGIDEPIAMIKNNQTYYYHADGLGSIIAITDSTGNVVQRYEYDSFGNITYKLDSNFKQPYTYTGREWDEESGLYYYRARYYDAKIGRFISKDPIGFVGGENLYGYVRGNPINNLDPSGLLFLPDDPTDPDFLFTPTPEYMECTKNYTDTHRQEIDKYIQEFNKCIDGCRTLVRKYFGKCAELGCEANCFIDFYAKGLKSAATYQWHLYRCYQLHKAGRYD